MEEENEIYSECLRNHAASLGSYATDGCGEFTLDDTAPSGLQCAACGCHRNFHRKVIYVNDGGGGGGGGGGKGVSSSSREVVEVIDYGSRKPNTMVESPDSYRSSKKRVRTKFTAEQKEKMLGFAEKLGWRLTRKDQEDEVERFCREIGVNRQVFKVWMHNHKNSSSSSGNVSSLIQ